MRTLSLVAVVATALSVGWPPTAGLASQREVGIQFDTHCTVCDINVSASGGGYTVEVSYGFDDCNDHGSDCLDCGDHDGMECRTESEEVLGTLDTEEDARGVGGLVCSGACDVWEGLLQSIP